MLIRGNTAIESIYMDYRLSLNSNLEKIIRIYTCQKLKKGPDGAYTFLCMFMCLGQVSPRLAIRLVNKVMDAIESNWGNGKG